MAMAYWRYNVLIELFECDNAFILSDDQRSPVTPPDIVYGGVHGERIPWSKFDQLVQAGDIVEEKRVTIENTTMIYYRISESGKAALQALPNFDKRFIRQRAVTL